MTNSKYSHQRELLIDILKSTKSHPNADTVYESARRIMPNISLGTVYRNLSKLSHEGVIQKLVVGDGCDRYDGDTSPHTHFVCDVCGKVFDIYYDFSDELIKSASRFTDSDISSCAVTLRGVCGECRTKTRQ